MRSWLRINGGKSWDRWRKRMNQRPGRRLRTIMNLSSKIPRTKEAKVWFMASRCHGRKSCLKFKRKWESRLRKSSPNCCPANQGKNIVGLQVVDPDMTRNRPMVLEKQKRRKPKIVERWNGPRTTKTTHSAKDHESFRSQKNGHE